jgi:hypothetical protein
MYPLQDFLNHGLLPFTGRSTELDRLLEFWRTTTGGSGIRLALLTGEAGSGKSRLLEMLRPLVIRQGGVVVHLKLYPDSSSAIIPLLIRSLIESRGTGDLLQQQPEPTIADASATMRRLARLRPTLLVIEDAHLLTSGALGDLSRLLGALSDESIAVLCLARPLEQTVRGVLEPYLVIEETLRGIHDDELATLWRTIFGSEPQPEVIRIVARTPLGNPLAIRSGLRGAIRSGAIAAPTGSWRITVALDEFEKRLARGVDVLSEGMAAHLSDEEREAAQTLACLGEVFSREAAEVLLEDTQRMLELLLFKGIIIMTDISMRSVNGRTSPDPLYSFTHTLVQRHFAEEASPDADRLVRLIATRAPLYSILPFQLLWQHRDHIVSTAEEIELAIKAAINFLPYLNNSGDWPLTRALWPGLLALVGAGDRVWDVEQQRLIAALVLDMRIQIDVRNHNLPRFSRNAHRLLRMVEDSHDIRMKSLQLRAMAHLFISGATRENSDYERLHHACEDLVARYPELAFSRDYMLFLRRMIREMDKSGTEMAGFAEQRIKELMARDDAPARFQTMVQKEFYPHLLRLVRNGEEYVNRLALIREIEAPNGPVRDYATKTVGLFYSGGYLVETDARLSMAIQHSQNLGDRRATYYNQLCRIGVDLMFGEEIERGLAQFGRIQSMLSVDEQERLREVVGHHLIPVLILCAGEERTLQFAEEYQVTNQLKIHTAISLALAAGRPLPPADTGLEIDSGFMELIRIASSATPDQKALAIHARQLLAEEPYVIEQLGSGWTALSIMERIAPGELPSIQETIHQFLLRWLPWLEERMAVAPLEQTLQRYERWLTRAEAREWRNRAQALRRRRQEQKPTPTVTRLQLSMLGVITVAHPDGAPERVKGARVGKFLGILVADRMLREPLSFRELCRLVAGRDDEEPERARKALNDAVYRVRELLGPDAILTDRGRSELNIELVEVDLLKADHLLRDAGEALKERALARALRSMIAVLDITRGEVPFPGLYDDFFEAARAEFEYRLRSILLEVARRLLLESDVAGAEVLLRRGFEAMPEDEEMAELLRESLQRAGRFTEAERIRMRGAEAAVDY